MRDFPCASALFVRYRQRPALLILRIPVLLKPGPVDKPYDCHNQINASLRKVNRVEMCNVHPHRNDISNDPPDVLLSVSEQF